MTWSCDFALCACPVTSSTDDPLRLPVRQCRVSRTLAVVCASLDADDIQKAAQTSLAAVVSCDDTATSSLTNGRQRTLLQTLSPRSAWDAGSVRPISDARRAHHLCVAHCRRLNNGLALTVEAPPGRSQAARKLILLGTSRRRLDCRIISGCHCDSRSQTAGTLVKMRTFSGPWWLALIKVQAVTLGNRPAGVRGQIPNTGLRTLRFPPGYLRPIITRWADGPLQMWKLAWPFLPA
ncbi:hypothetical protein C8R47DRAFT_213769 [Mycena vitilis]|nr:hypothetical protein C8R47DRAFT_213769 [Mycena vitilis]